MPDFWGKHQLIDCADCDRLSIADEDVIKIFLQVLVDRIGMKAYGEPILAHFATHDPSKGGYTFVQMIETSLIDGHLVDQTGDAYISVHSCKDFDERVVVDTIMEFFQPTVVNSKAYYRKA